MGVLGIFDLILHDQIEIQAIGKSVANFSGWKSIQQPGAKVVETEIISLPKETYLIQ